MSESNQELQYTVRTIQYSSSGNDINGVCRLVRDSLGRGIIPVIEIDEPPVDTKERGTLICLESDKQMVPLDTKP